MKALLALLCCCLSLSAETLEAAADRIARESVEKFAPGGLHADQLAITLVDLKDRAHPQWAAYHGQELFYPASVVKLFYLVAVHARFEAGDLRPTPELERAIRDMIVESSNDATQAVFQTITGTTSGPELSGEALAEFLDKREWVNRYFAAQGYQAINTNQAAYAESPYLRDRQARGPNFERNNKLNTDAVARLLLAIVEGKAVSAARSHAMMDLLHRDPFLKDNPDEQATMVSGQSLPPGSQYYSKAGWTEKTRHDAAYIRLPNGAEYISVIFTRDNSKQTALVPFVAKRIVDYFQTTPSTPAAASKPSE